MNGFHESSFQNRQNSQESLYQEQQDMPYKSAPKLIDERQEYEILHKVSSGKIVFSKNQDFKNKREAKASSKSSKYAD